MKKIFNYSSEKVLSISAITIAVISIFVAVWESSEIRKHNRLSVRPKLEIYYNSSENLFGYVVANNGLGPAVITDKYIFIDGKEINYSGFSGYDELLEKLDLVDKYAGHGAINPGKTIIAGKNEYIIYFNLDESDDREILLPQIYSMVTIEIEYESIYGEAFKCKIPSKED